MLGEAFSASSALLKHEVAYVMGQMQHPASADVLCKVLQVGGVCLLGSVIFEKCECVSVENVYVLLSEKGVLGAAGR